MVVKAFHFAKYHWRHSERFMNHTRLSLTQSSEDLQPPCSQMFFLQTRLAYLTAFLICAELQITFKSFLSVLLLGSVFPIWNILCDRIIDQVRKTLFRRGSCNVSYLSLLILYDTIVTFNSGWSWLKSWLQVPRRAKGSQERNDIYMKWKDCRVWKSMDTFM